MELQSASITLAGNRTWVVIRFRMLFTNSVSDISARTERIMWWPKFDCSRSNMARSITSWSANHLKDLSQSSKEFFREEFLRCWRDKTRAHALQVSPMDRGHSGP